MTDRYRVYTKVLKTLKSQPGMYSQGHVVTLAMMIASIVMSRKAEVVLLGDGEYDDTEMVDWVQTQTDWSFA